MKRFLYFLILAGLLFPGFTFAEDDGGDTEEVKSITEERRDILRYGIDSQVLEILSSLEDEKSEALLPEALEVFQHSLNTKVKLAVLSYFIALEYHEAAETVLDYIKTWDREDMPDDVLGAGIRYIAETGEAGTGEALDLYKDLCRHESDTVARAAIAALGHSEESSIVDFLTDLYEDDDTPDNLKGSIIESLGTMKAEDAVSMIEDILDDPEQDRSLRWKACRALGEIGDRNSLPVLRRALSSDDTYLRSYAVSALGSFEGDDIQALLIEALKDSFWRVRVGAAESLGVRKSKEAVPILMFKAEKDPEPNVRVASLKALAEIDTSETVDFISSLFENKRTASSLRTEAAVIMIDRYLDDSLDIVEKVLSEVWEDTQASFRNTIGKQLSLAENRGLESIFGKMLDHPDITMRLYAIRGIARNGFSSLKPRIEELSGEGHPRVVRKEALAALETM